jgi:hypothetical protein
MLHARPTPLCFHAPTVLAVGCAPDVLSSASRVLRPMGVALSETTLLDLRTDSARLRPLVLLVDAELYDFDPEAFDMVAQDVGAKLGVVGSPQEAEVTIGGLIDGLSRRSGGAASQRPPPPSAEERTRKWALTADELGVPADVLE